MSEPEEIKGELLEQNPMTRSLSVERTYALAQYQNIKLFDSFNQVPYEFMLNQEMINKIRYLQLIDLELAYRRYIKLAEEFHDHSMDEALVMLQTIKIDTMSEIKNLFENKGE
jgi:hypothetical protein